MLYDPSVGDMPPFGFDGHGGPPPFRGGRGGGRGRGGRGGGGPPGRGGGMVCCDACYVYHVVFIFAL